MKRNRGQACSDPIAIVPITIAAVVAYVALSIGPAEYAEFQAAADQTATPCYYFCGPWYTWLVTWMIGIFALSLLLSVGVTVWQRWKVDQ